MKDIFRNTEFEEIFQKVKDDVNSYLVNNRREEKDNLTTDDIIMWQRNQLGHYLVHPSHKCPENIKDDILSIIAKHNPTL